MNTIRKERSNVDHELAFPPVSFYVLNYCSRVHFCYNSSICLIKSLELKTVILHFSELFSPFNFPVVFLKDY